MKFSILEFDFVVKIKQIKIIRFKIFKEAAGFGITLGYVLEYGKLPEWLNFDPAFQIWSQTGNHISALLNDLLGFKKDVINGETDNMIFYHMRQGLSVQEAITKEIGDFR